MSEDESQRKLNLACWTRGSNASVSHAAHIFIRCCPLRMVPGVKEIGSEFKCLTFAPEMYGEALGSGDVPVVNSRFRDRTQRGITPRAESRIDKTARIKPLQKCMRVGALIGIADAIRLRKAGRG